jgi:hypothetical protein
MMSAMRRAWANRILCTAVVAVVMIALGVLLWSVLTGTEPGVEIALLALPAGLIALALAEGTVRWVPEPCLPPYRHDQEAGGTEVVPATLR